ncbi:MAG: O-methyltransferase [Spirochaetia bacterium]|jgi:predicted O-methyltransferase YrrM|nr:O-methyltransferase [Spirochaetia bacterium]
MDYLQYLRSFISGSSEVIDRIEKESGGRDDIQPFVEPETGKFLSFLVKTVNAVKVLELGTGIGNSAIWMGEALKENNGTLLTVDNHPRTKHEAIENIASAGLSDVVTMIEGNAEDVIEKMCCDGSYSFDMVFQDCGKYLYPLLHEKIVSLTRSGGIIIADDTLFHVNNDVRKNLGKYTDEYNKMVFADRRLYSVILPVGHGMTLSLKN